jgi:hypothetical protein
MIISNFIWNFIQENIGHSDNNPTKFSVLSYAYFQMLYNVGTLFEKNGIESKDRVIPLKKRNEIRKGIVKYPKIIRKNVLKTYLYIAHNAFISKLYPNAKLLTPQDYGLKKIIDIEKSTMNALKEYSESHFLEKKVELERAMFMKEKNTTGMAADYTGTTFPNSNPEPNPFWEQLVLPTGVVKDENDLPLIDETKPLSFKIQNFLGSEFYKNTGFAVTPTKNIINLDSKISKTWENGLQKQTDLLLDIYKNLTDEKKIIAEFFAGSSKNALPPPGFMICIAMQLSQKYKQSIMDELKMYFSISAGLFDACLGAWFYKTKYKQARPINLIRKYYADKKIKTWTPLDTSTSSSEINGKQWLPYQPFTFVTPPFPDVASGHTTFSIVAAQILNWWFNNPVLYDGCSLAVIPNQQLLCPSLNIHDKMVCIGEYIFDKGCSEIEPGVIPKEKIVLRYKTLEDLAAMAGLSRIYGGIHTFETNEVSAELGTWIFEQTHNKLINEFKFKSPHSL